MGPALLALIAPALSAVAIGAAPRPEPAAPSLPAFRRCIESPFTAAPAQPWRHPKRARLRVALGPANHAVQDVLATPGAAATLRAKLAYGAASKDLEHETVRVFLDACSGFRRVGDFRTDDEGRIAVPVPRNLAPGVYDVRIEVMGDASVAPGRIWILPRGTRLAVTDIDGTLTTSDEEMVRNVVADLFQPIASGAHVPGAYPGAAALTNALARRGYVVVFLTGRPYGLTAKTREWLSSGGFAPGPLRLASRKREAIPSVSGVGAFKRAYLRSLAAAGLVVEEAYGNATTDVAAYAGAGIPASATWIIGPNGGAGGTRAAPDSWKPRAAAVSAMPPVAQPFTAPPGDPRASR